MSEITTNEHERTMDLPLMRSLILRPSPCRIQPPKRPHRKSGQGYNETRSFEQILSIIRAHRAGALASVNMEHLLSHWEIGGYLSAKIKRDRWGQATIDNLVDFIHANAPEERGYGRRNLYNMVAVYEAFTAPDFAELVGRYGARIVQTASGKIVQPAAAQIPISPEVQPPPWISTAAGNPPPGTGPDGRKRSP